jgi:probable LLM family oxidoreductase
MEFGIYSFVEWTPDQATGKKISAQQRIRDLMEEIELADQTGLDVFAIGEHHRPDYLASSPAIILAAAAAKTKRIKLSSAVSVISSDDPVRVFQDFATIDLISGGRAEIMAGRGSFIESFPLFGYDLKDYDELFSEKLELLLKLNDSEKITWKGIHRPSINNLGIYPRPVQEKIPVWIAVGGTPESAIRAGSLGLPMAVAIIGGSAVPFVPFVKLYRDSAANAGHDPAKLSLGINSHAYISENSQQAAEEYFPPYAEVMNRIGRERGWSGITRPQYDLMRSQRGALLVGSPQEIIDKIMYEYELFKNQRVLLQMSVGTLPHDKLMHSIELLGTIVAPAVKKMISREK